MCMKVRRTVKKRLFPCAVIAVDIVIHVVIIMTLCINYQGPGSKERSTGGV